LRLPLESYNKSSPVAEMGDRDHNKYWPKRGGGCCAPLAGELGPRLTQCGLGQGLLPYQVASSSIQPFAHNLEMEQKLGLHAPLLGGAATPCNNVALAEVYLRTEWHLDPSSCLATIDMGQKLGGGQSRLNVLVGPGPTRLMGPPWERVSGVGAVVPCTR